MIYLKFKSVSPSEDKPLLPAAKLGVESVSDIIVREFSLLSKNNFTYFGDSQVHAAVEKGYDIIKNKDLPASHLL